MLYFSALLVSFFLSDSDGSLHTHESQVFVVRMWYSHTNRDP